MSTNTVGDGDSAMAEAQYVKAKTSVWWDIQNCQVPNGIDAYAIAQNISSALMKMNYSGPVSIHAYGDTKQIPLTIQHALNSTGIALNHVPSGVKDASDKKILVDMLFWALDNPAPANFMLISGDRDFSNALHGLSFRRYNILLAQPLQSSVSLIHAATTVWLWKSLSAGGIPLKRRENPKLIENAKPLTSGSEIPLQDCIPSSQPHDSNSDSRSIFDKIKFIPKPSNYQPAMPNILEDKHNNNTQGKQFKKAPHEYFDSSELSVSTSTPTPSLLSSSVNPFPGNVMSNPPNQNQNKYNYPSRPGPFPPRQPYPNPDPSWKNGNSIPNHVQNYYHNAGRPVSSHVQSPYGNVFRPYCQENLHPPSGGNGFRPMHTSNDGSKFSSPPLLSTSDISNLSVSPLPSQTQNRPYLYPQVRQEYRPKITSSSTISNGPNKGHLPPNSNALVTQPTTATSSINAFTHGVSPSQPPVVTKSGSSNSMCGTQECPPPEYVQGLIGVVLHALNILKTEKITPTEPNISDCIQYGEPNHRGTDVKKALESALEHNMIMVKNVDKLKIYTVKNENLWKCINPSEENPSKYPKSTWDRVKKFIISSSGRAALTTTKCRYEAAQVFKKECLKELTLGDIIQILNITVTTKEWITPHQTGWKPITINLAAETTSETTTDKDTGIQPVA